MATLEEIGPALPATARRAIAQWLGGDGFGAFTPGGPPSAVFVTLRTGSGALRGCIGSLVASQPDLVNETARSAVLAATRDPRFMPVALTELAALTIEVSVLEPEEPVAAIGDLDPRTYGVIVRDASESRGLLLPGIEGIDDAATQVDIARQKAGIRRGVPLLLSRFRVHKWEEAGER
jgi:AmmeMemoRadiSam system protein A